MVGSPPKSHHVKEELLALKSLLDLLVCCLLRVVGLSLRDGHFFGRGWEGAGRSSLSGSRVPLQCQSSANEEPASWLRLRTAAPQLQAVGTEEAAGSPRVASEAKSLGCRPAGYVWHNKPTITADITSIQGQGCTQDLVISST